MKDFEPRYGTHGFYRKLERAENVMLSRLPTAGGEKLVELTDRIDTVRNYILKIRDNIKPRSAGYGVIGEGSLRASRGGRF